MARYNSVNTTTSIAGGTTIYSPASGLLTTLTGSGTVTIPNPILYTGQTQTFYNSTGSAITLSTPSGNFTGAGASGNGNLTVPGSSVVTVVSDGANYIVQAWIGGAITVGGTLTANGAVSLNPTGLNVSIQPTGTGTLNLSSGSVGSLDNVSIGATSQSSAKFTTLEASGITKVTANTVSTTYQDGALIVSGGVGIAKKLFVNDSIKAGSAGATTGTIIIQANYSDGSLTTFGTEYSSGGPSLGYAVYPSSSAAGAFLSASGAASLQRAAYNMNGNTHNWYAGAAQTVAIGSSASLYNAMSLSTTALTVSNAANVVMQNTTAAPTNSQSAPGYIQLIGLGWNTLSGSTQYQGQIALGGTYSGSSGSTEPAITFSLAGTGNSGYNAGAGPSALTERVRITNYGFVGIGQSAPTSPLHVENSATATTVNFKNNSALGYAFGISKLGETYQTSTTSGVTPYEVAGTLGNFTALPNSVNTGAILTFNAYNSANGASGAYCGAVAGSVGNGPASFVIGRRTGSSTFAESVRVDTLGRVILNDVLFVGSELQHIGTVSANNISSAGYKELFRISSSRLVTSGIFSISATRGNFVTGATFSWTSSHPVAGTITQLSSTNYTQVTVTLDIASDGSAIISINWTGYDASFPMSYQVTVMKTAGGTVDFSSQGTAWDTVATNYTRYHAYTTLANGFKANNGVFMGSLSKGSGSFKIDHPLPELTETNYLVHSFIEGPNADLIYRGEIELIDGKALVDIDQHSRMTAGTFEVLCRKVQCFTTNETDWTPVRGKINGNILTIEAQDSKSTATVSWMVIGERKDPHMYETEWTDTNGEVVVEPLKNPVRTDFPPYPEHVNTSESTNGTL